MIEQHYNNYNDYIEKTKLKWNQVQGESHNITKMHATRTDPKTPYFRVFTCHHIVLTFLI